MTFPNFERTRLVGNPTPGESVHDPLVLPYLGHDLARHFGDQRNQQRLWKVLEARLRHQSNRAARSKRILTNGVKSMRNIP